MSRTASLHPPAVRTGRIAWAVALVSTGVIGFEIALMRLLLVASWHHFAFLVISIALLGFGASGSMLYVLRDRLLPRADGWLFGLVLATAASMPAAVTAVGFLPVEARFLPATLAGQVGWWLAYWAILALVFTLGGAAVGLALMMSRQDVGRIYAANLVGSGAGGALATGLMWWIAPAWLGPVMGGVVILALPALRTSRPKLSWAAAGAIVIGLGCLLILLPPSIRIDPFKFRAHVQRLERQGLAERVAHAYSPRGVVEVFSGPMFHNLPFLSVGLAPPPIHALLIDGHDAASVLDVDGPDEAAVVDQTLMATAYELAADHPRVLLLGERGGTNIWLAHRRGASVIDAVQSDRRIVELMRGPLRDRGGAVLNLPDVRAIVDEPRHFVETTGQTYDLIDLVSLQTLVVGGGMAGLGQDHLITVEGLTACLQCLSEDGVLSISRGIHDPPRDNVKLLATLVEVLRRTGADDPSAHVVILRDYLGVTTIAKPTPWTDRQVEQVRRTVDERQLTPVWFTGVRPDELNHPDRLAGPRDQAGDWFHHAALRLFADDAPAFIRDWAYDVRPPTDQRPFFLDFFRLRSVGLMRKTFGDLWLTRVEMAWLFVAAVILVVGLAGGLATLGPLAIASRGRPPSRWTCTAVYFTVIGLAYLMLEITVLARLTHLIGDPVIAAAVTIATFLIASGLGSAAAGRSALGGASVLQPVVVALVGLGLAQLMLVAPLTLVAAHWPEAGRIALAIVMVAPVAFLMGFPMPTALARLDRAAPSLVPWAWGVNGFASVLAAPLATLIGMTHGFHLAGLAALTLYAFVGWLFPRLPDAS